uniref:DELLA protein n=1 Tax=Tamarix hispida TaxID=189793 RepID=A0A2S1WLL5_9CARY|nr:GRAS11 [Tamarix hispida]
MVRYDLAAITTARSSSSSSSSPATKPTDIDGQLAGAGYRVRSSELRQVAQQLERLENVMGKAPTSDLSELASDSVVHHNPSDLASWVDSLLSELTPLVLESESSSPGLTLPAAVYSDPYNICSSTNMDHWLVGGANTWRDQIPEHQRLPPQQYGQHPLTVVSHVEEDSGIRLVHLLMTCADSVQRGALSLAGFLIEDMRGLITRVSTDCGIGKVAAFFIDALSRRLYQPCTAGAGVGFEHEILYHYFYEASPYLKFAHFTANQAILEAFEGQDCVHVVDFSLMHGLQWPPLIQALALRPGGPPLLTITGVGPASPDGRDLLREVGLKLAELARSVNVRFNFHGVVASRLEDVEPWMLQVSLKEAVAVNSMMQLHRLLGSDPGQSPGIDRVLNMIRDLNPKIVTVVEQEANHNKPGFLDRFTEALYYYSTMFDSLAACQLQPEKALAEMYIQREICNIVCCEGSARVERHEPLAKWRVRLSGAGFKPLYLGSNAFKQASMLLTLFSAEGYCVEEIEGCLTLGWHSRPLISASAWQGVSNRESM